MKRVILSTLLSVTVALSNQFSINDLGGGANIPTSTKGKNEPLVYKDMLSFLKNSHNAEQLMILGSLYANGTTKKDSLGEIIPIDIILAKKYLIKSAEMGNNRALTILGGLILFKKEMNKLDPKLKLAEKYLRFAFDSGDNEAAPLLSNILFRKNKNQEAIEVLVLSSNRGDSTSQLALAFLFKQGFKGANGFEVKSNIKLAEKYLNEACLNENRSDKVKKTCMSSKFVEMVTK